MTNAELLRLPVGMISQSRDRQRRWVLEEVTREMPCPVCGKEQSVLDAAGIAIDAFDFGATPRVCTCNSAICSAPLVEVVPMARMGVSSWHWSRDFSRPRGSHEVAT